MSPPISHQTAFLYTLFPSLKSQPIELKTTKLKQALITNMVVSTKFSQNKSQKERLKHSEKIQKANINC